MYRNCTGATAAELIYGRSRAVLASHVAACMQQAAGLGSSNCGITLCDTAHRHHCVVVALPHAGVM